jgi:HD-GYP domain-containing protein (c-di-GMP phosphodiesterase class II)
MKTVYLDQIIPGMIVSRLINSPDGEFLVGKGHIITKHNIERLRNFGINFLYIEDDATEGIESAKVVSDEIRFKATFGVKRFFSSVQNGDPISMSNCIQEMKKAIESIIREILSNDVGVINICNLKTFDDYTYAHSTDVCTLSLILGMAMDLNREQLKTLATAAILHDIGKMMVPKEILNKPGKLTDEEFEEMKKHSMYGYELLKGEQLVSEEVYTGILCHHEKWNGAGYPYGLKGNNINLYSRIIAIADVYDALVSDRPYRKGWSPSEAYEYIIAHSDILFDPSIVKIFSSKIAAYPIGSVVKLSNGYIAVVKENFQNTITRPLVTVIKDENERDFGPTDLDLRKECSTTIIDFKR